MEVLITEEAFFDTQNGPRYEPGQLWVGDKKRAEEIKAYGVAKNATVQDIKHELDARGVKYDAKLGRDKLIELLKGE